MQPLDKAQAETWIAAGRQGSHLVSHELAAALGISVVGWTTVSAPVIKLQISPYEFGRWLMAVTLDTAHGQRTIFATTSCEDIIHLSREVAP